ncbi:transposon Tf2-6 polyprotein [Trichonephila clavata]|uniref:Transposon Tf2-6 polyprotein n=1 Tax=Trichonephila clavata TaxID=2740835 RepID=A0A8X6J5R3_TRICU|nr:transposon Tf2-6 polyprotein [Trichonephila clavata]
MKFKPAFSKCIKTLGHCDLVTPTISTIHPHPISSTLYPIPQSLQTHAQNYLEELIAADIIEENTAEWASPMVLVKKKNHTNDNPSLRLALDLRLLNNVIDGCSYPLPKIQDITTKLAGFKLFTVLDLNSAYWQIHLPKTDWTKQFFLNTDGSHIAIAGILMQKQDGGELQPISYYSRILTVTEFRYPANKIELLAIHNNVK